MDEFYQDLSPMLFYESEPFDSEDHLFELKFDGIRALAYLDTDKTIIKNKRHKDVTNLYPELNNLHKQAKTRCIIDGEIVVMINGKPDFFKMQKRSLLQDPFKIQISSQSYPVTFIAFDIIYYRDYFITDLPLIERKKILQENIVENNMLVISRFIEKNGIKFFEVVKKQGLEGIVAKEMLSKYFLGKRSKAWLKFKVYGEDDLVVCGYLEKDNKTIDIIFGRLLNNHLIKAATINTSKDKKLIIDFAKKNPSSPLFPNEDNQIIWMKPHLVGKVKYMMKTESGSLRQAVFLGLRDDKYFADLKKEWKFTP